METPIHLLAFSGSLRKGSYNTRLLHIAAGMLPAGVSMEIFDLAPLPLYNEDVRQQGYPPPVEEFRSKIKTADGLLIATPEYNYSVTGVLKNAIDWASRPDGSALYGMSPLYGKPMAMMGVGGRFGTARAQLHLRQIAVHVNMLPLTKPEIYIQNLPNKAFDEEGNLLDQNTVKLIGDLMVELARWARLHKP